MIKKKSLINMWNYLIFLVLRRNTLTDFSWFFFLDVCLLFTERSLFTTTVPYAVRIVSRRDTAFLAGLYKYCKINFTFNF